MTGGAVKASMSGFVSINHRRVFMKSTVSKRMRLLPPLIAATLPGLAQAEEHSDWIAPNGGGYYGKYHVVPSGSGNADASGAVFMRQGRRDLFLSILGSGGASREKTRTTEGMPKWRRDIFQSPR